MLPAPFSREFLNRLEVLRLKTRKDVLGNNPGSYSGPRRGTSLEFADYRKYSPGDDLRYLDWGVLARTDRLYVKLFHEEVDLFAHVFIDASGSMLFPTHEEKFSPACQLALALAYAVLANNDNVKFHLMERQAIGRSSPFYRGRHRIMDAVRFVDSVTPAGSLNMAEGIRQHLQRIRRPGKAIVISDFLMEAQDYQHGLRLLQTSNFDITLIQVLSRAEMDPPFPRGGLIVQENETQQEVRLQWTDEVRQRYREALEHRLHDLRTYCHQRSIDVSLYVTDEDLVDYVLKILPTIGIFK
jgi:uncharacterized protein (DUF58 family)